MAHQKEVADYEVAIEAVIGIGWAEEAYVPGKFRLTETGREPSEQAGQLRDRLHAYSRSRYFRLLGNTIKQGRWSHQGWARKREGNSSGAWW